MSATTESLNRTLRSELGSNPPFAWKHSESLLRVVGKIKDDGSPDLEYVTVGGIVRAQQKKFTRKLDPRLVDQWVLCMLVEMSEDQGHINGTGKAAWVIVYDQRGNAVAMEQGLEPSADATWRFIHLLRESEKRKVTTEDIVERERREYDKFAADAADCGLDAMTAYLEIPGKKGSTEFQAGIRDTPLAKDTTAV